MITKLRSAAIALERVSIVDDDCDILAPSLADAVADAITDLRTVIAQLEQAEPVAWMVEDHDNRHFIFRMQKPEVIVGETLTPLYTHSAPDHKPLGEVVHTGVIRWSNKYPQVGTQLYAAPVQPVREVLTDEQIDRCIEAADARWADSFVPVQWARHLAKAIEAAHGITKD